MGFTFYLMLLATVFDPGMRLEKGFVGVLQTSVDVLIYFFDRRLPEEVPGKL